MHFIHKEGKMKVTLHKNPTKKTAKRQLNASTQKGAFPLHWFTMLLSYFTKRGPPGWRGLAFNKVKGSIFVAELRNLHSNHLCKVGSRDQTLKICFVYLCSLCIWYREEMEWMATSLSRMTLRTKGQSIVIPESWPTHRKLKLRANKGIWWGRSRGQGQLALN